MVSYKAGETWQEEVCFLDVVVFGRQAEAVGNALHKGSQALVEGRVRQRTWEGFVANFAQEVMKGQLPWSVGGLRGQGIELFGRSEAFVSLLHHHLPFLNHVHEFDPNYRVLG